MHLVDEKDVDVAEKLVQFLGSFKSLRAEELLTHDLDHRMF